jgi:chromosome partitioning protein
MTFHRPNEEGHPHVATIPAPAAEPNTVALVNPETRTDPDEATKVYVVGALKGGTGKTRIAMLIALLLCTVLRRRVMFIDADSVSQTSSEWPKYARRRGYTWPFEVIRHPLDDLDDKLDELIATGLYDDIVVDVGGGNVLAFQGAVTKAKRLIVPLYPDQGDLTAAPKTRQSAILAARGNTVGGVMMFYVLNRCNTSSNDAAGAREMLLNEDQKGGAYPLVDTDLPGIVAYSRAFGRIPGVRVPDDLVDHIRWKDLTGFVPLMLETEIITPDQALDKKLITKRELEKVDI